MTILYNLFLALYTFLIRLASLWNEKARLWVEGRKDFKTNISSACLSKNGPIIWMHCASLGEFEQGRELIERIKMTYPSHRILLTFFSPSGYEAKKNYAQADMIFYLPLDGKSNAKFLIDTIKPKLVIFVKYDSWYYYLSTLKNRNIPTLLISAKFTKNLSLFGFFGGFLRNMLEYYTHIFVQDQASLELLKEYGVRAPISITGDTRFDRVIDIANNSFSHPAIEQFCNNNQILVAGSTWEKDEEMLELLQKNIAELKFIIAPHEVSPNKIERLQKQFPSSQLLSIIEQEGISSKTNVLIIDSIGLLSKLYRYGTICYVGGGFKKTGIHNILEASVYGKIVLFGKYYGFSNEAQELIKIGSAYSFDNPELLVDLVKSILSEKSELEKKNYQAKKYTEDNKGATEKIIHYLEENRLLINSTN